MKKILLLIVFSILLLLACTTTGKTAMKTRNVFYAGGDNGVKVALLKAGYTLVDDFDKTEVFVLNGEIPNANAVASKLQNGSGLVLIVGEEMSFRDVEILFDYPVSALIKTENLVNLVVDESSGNDPLTTEIDWKDAPQIRERAFIMTSARGRPMVRVDGNVEVFLGEIGRTAEKKYVLDAFLDEKHNVQFQEWKYFDYLIYHLVERAAGAKPMNFADYSAQMH